MAVKLAFITFFTCILSATGQRPNEQSCRQLPPKCTCGSTVINCTNVVGLSIESLNKIPMYFNKLTTLHLIGNDFEYLDKDTFHLDGSVGWNLAQLDLSNNTITDIHEQAFIKFRGLQELKLANNRISFLRRPYASGHRVTNTGSFLTPIAPSLNILDLSNAFDKEERRQPGQFMPNLTKLVFNPENQFNQLQYVDLSKNDLTWLPPNAFQAMPTLQHLYLSNNRLTTFQMDEKSGKGLAELYLQSNNIQHLDEAFMKMVDDRPTLETLALANNPFLCDCQSKAMISWVKKSTKIKDKESMLCLKAMPQQFVNRSLIWVDEDQLRCNDGRSAVYAAGVFALCSVAAIGLISLLTCIIYANKNILFRTGTSIRNWLTMASSGGYEILESARPGTVKAEAV